MIHPPAWWLREGKPLALSKTALETWQRCPAEFAYRYCYDLDGRSQATPLARGISWGVAMQMWWAAPASVRLEVARGALSACPDFGALGPTQQIILRAMLAVYDEVYRTTDVAGEVFDEETLVGPLTSDAYSRLKADLVIDAPGKNPVVIEFKSTEADISEDAWYWEKLRFDPQVMGYWNAYPDLRLVYDVAKVPNLRPEPATPVSKRKFYRRGSKDGSCGPGDPMPGTRLLAETEDEFYSRVVEYLRMHRFSHYVRREIIVSPEAKDDLSLDMVYWSRQITQAASAGEWPKKVSSCRRGKQGMCTFYHTCFGGVQPEKNQLYRIRERQ